jgi:tetratricopeptide (TPR) repeat protein
MLIALTPAQFRGVVAHELGHLRRRHNTFSSWIYRVQRTWESLAAPFASTGRIRLITMGWFVRWYGAYFATSTLALRRLHEYEADRHSAATDGPEATADVLLAIDFAAYRMTQEFWPALFRGAARDALPPSDVFARTARFFATAANPDTLRRWWERERRTRTPITHEHPRLADRLANIGFPDRLAADPDPRLAGGIDPAASALALLGPDSEKLCATANASWKTMVIGRWRMEHALATKSADPQNGDTNPNDPEATAKPGEREWDDLQPRAQFAEPDEAIALLREFLARFPEHAGAHFALGAMLLERDDDRAAAPHLEAAARHGSEYIGPALELLLDYYRTQGRDDDADPIRVRLEAHERALASARKERLRVGRRDRFRPHDLTPRQLLKIRRTLNLYPQVRAAYLVRKDVRLFADKPSYVLAVERRARLLDEHRRRTDKHLVDSLGAQVEIPCAVVVLGWSALRLRSRLLRACPVPVFDSRD